LRARWLIPVVAILVVGTALVLRAGGDAPSSPSSSSHAAGPDEGAGRGTFPARVVTAGAIDIVIEPLRIDETGAVFHVAMNTHSENLSADLANTALLRVGGVEWAGAIWSGSPPGGHHREGELTFEARGAASGSAVLSIGGFPTPVEASWTLGG
jgi:hypothetical protein